MYFYWKNYFKSFLAMFLNHDLNNKFYTNFCDNMDLDFLANFAVSNSEDEFSSSKEEILKVLKRIGVDTRFVSYFEDEEGSIKLYIENLRFSKFSRNRTSVFNKHYPDIEVVRSTLFQKICARSSKTLADSLNPRDKLLLPPMENDYSRLLYIVLEPYSRKYGIEFIEHDKNTCLDEVDSIISPLNLNQEVNHILNDIFDGKGIEWIKNTRMHLICMD